MRVDRTVKTTVHGCLKDLIESLIVCMFVCSERGGGGGNDVATV